MRWLVRLLLLLLVVVYVVRWLMRVLRPGLDRQRGLREERRGGRMERDPVCGTYVAREVSFSESAGDKTLYFCSEGCREQYRARRRQLEAGAG